MLRLLPKQRNLSHDGLREGSQSQDAPRYLANDLRLVTSAESCRAAMESRCHALASEKGIVESQRHGDIVAALPWLGLAAVDVVFMHASAKSCAAQQAGHLLASLLLKKCMLALHFIFLVHASDLHVSWGQVVLGCGPHHTEIS